MLMHEIAPTSDGSWWAERFQRQWSKERTAVPSARGWLHQSQWRAAAAVGKHTNPTDAHSASPGVSSSLRSSA